MQEVESEGYEILHRCGGFCEIVVNNNRRLFSYLRMNFYTASIITDSKQFIVQKYI